VPRPSAIRTGARGLASSLLKDYEVRAGKAIKGLSRGKRSALGITIGLAARTEVTLFDDRTRAWPFLELQRVPEVKAVKNRVHVDVAPEKGEDLAGAVSLLREADAVPADIGQGDVDWEVMADPEGHEFCVLTQR
jgi:hypothetical protein